MTINVRDTTQDFAVPFDKSKGSTGTFTLSFIYEQDLEDEVINIPITIKETTNRWLMFTGDFSSGGLINGQGHYTLFLNSVQYLNGRINILL